MKEVFLFLCIWRFCRWKYRFALFLKDENIFESLTLLNPVDQVWRPHPGFHFRATRWDKILKRPKVKKKRNLEFENYKVNALEWLVICDSDQNFLLFHSHCTKSRIFDFSNFMIVEFLIYLQNIIGTWISLLEIFQKLWYRNIHFFLP